MPLPSIADSASTSSRILGKELRERVRTSTHISWSHNAYHSLGKVPPRSPSPRGSLAFNMPVTNMNNYGRDAPKHRRKGTHLRAGTGASCVWTHRHTESTLHSERQADK
ncbi:unnamed protein product [Peniophora sp. CBMAI 1063]|nr:unnamed protein product [Peniophora sp. CBMAI 1063]